jgi:hypothetical protein
MTVSKVLVVGGGIRGRPFFSAASFRVETPPGGQPRNVTVALEGNGYVPMFRAVSDAVSDGLLEHPLRPLQDTIDVLQVMDDVRRQLSERWETAAYALSFRQANDRPIAPPSGSPRRSPLRDSPRRQRRRRRSGSRLGGG